MLYNEFELYPFKLKIMKLIESPYRISKSLKFIYILNGSLSISFTTNSNTLNENQVEIININELYRLTANSNNCAIAILSISNKYVQKYSYHIKKRIYNCTSNEFYGSGANEEHIDELKSLIASIILDMIISNYKELELHSETLLYILTKNFDDIKNLLKKTGSPLRNKRLYRIIDYIKSNLKDSVSLENLEKQEYISKEYLSREITKHFKKSFKEIQGYYRVMKATQLLLDTTSTIEKISQTAGFSSKRYFYKYFNIYYGCTPNIFRIKNKGIEYKSIELSSEELSNIIVNLKDIVKFSEFTTLNKLSLIRKAYEYRIRYESLKEMDLLVDLSKKYHENINLEIDISETATEEIDSIIYEIIEFVKTNRVVIKKLTLKSNKKESKQDDVIVKLNTFETYINESKIFMENNINIVYCIEP